MDTTNLIDKIFNVNINNQASVINDVFQFQYANNPIYKKWCDLLGTSNLELINNTNTKLLNLNSQCSIQNYPFLPISFFKSHSIKTTEFEPQLIFESSGTTQTINSKHLVKDASVYKRSFLTAFELAYGNAVMFARSDVRFLSLDDIVFRKPVPIGSFLALSSQIVYSIDSQFQVSVRADVVNPYENTRDTTNTFYFTFSISPILAPRVMPRSYDER